MPQSQLKILLTLKSSWLAKSSLRFFHTEADYCCCIKRRGIASFHGIAVSVSWHKQSSWGGSDSAGQCCERGEPFLGERWDAPRHTTEQGLCRQAGLTDSKGVCYHLTPESKRPEITSSICCHIVFGAIPLKQGSHNWQPLTLSQDYSKSGLPESTELC